MFETIKLYIIIWKFQYLKTNFTLNIIHSDTMPASLSTANIDFLLIYSIWKLVQSMLTSGSFSFPAIWREDQTLRLFVINKLIYYIMIVIYPV